MRMKVVMVKQAWEFLLPSAMEISVVCFVILRLVDHSPMLRAFWVHLGKTFPAN
jgi:hypothetical protein